MDEKKLKDEITTDPLARGYSAMTDRQVADDMNLSNRTRLREISSSELLAWSASTSDNDRPRYIKIQEASQHHVSEPVKAIAKASLRMVGRDGASLDLSLSDREQMIDALVGGSVLSQGDSDSLYSLATENISRATELGFSEVGIGWVQNARM